MPKKFVEALNETLDHVKTELMPDYDYESERQPRAEKEEGAEPDSHESSSPSTNTSGEQDTEYKSSSGIGDDEEIKWG